MHYPYFRAILANFGRFGAKYPQNDRHIIVKVKFGDSRKCLGVRERVYGVPTALELAKPGIFSKKSPLQNFFPNPDHLLERAGI